MEDTSKSGGKQNTFLSVVKFSLNSCEQVLKIGVVHAPTVSSTTQVL